MLRPGGVKRVKGKLVPKHGCRVNHLRHSGGWGLVV
jgi:hypothetical protein